MIRPVYRYCSNAETASDFVPFWILGLVFSGYLRRSALHQWTTQWDSDDATTCNHSTSHRHHHRDHRTTTTTSSDPMHLADALASAAADAAAAATIAVVVVLAERDSGVAGTT